MSNFKTLYLLERNETLPIQADNKSNTARLGDHISFECEELNKLGYNGLTAIHYDLMVLCGAIEFADKFYPRNPELWRRNICVSIPVHKPDTWCSSENLGRLQKLLARLTGDEWRFKFRPYLDSPFTPLRERRLIGEDGVEFAMAFSDGIDSLCVHELYGAKDVSRRVHAGTTQPQYNNRLDYVHVPFTAKPKRIQEHGGRTRTFKFSALTGIVAHLCQVYRVVVTESGQSSIGPSILPLLNIFPDYRCHPAFFRSMERFLESILGVKITFEQPRLFHTKAETIQQYKKKRLQSGLNASKLPPILGSTRSCSSRRFNVAFGGSLHHCGICGGCLLRRMSLFVAGIDDPNENYTVSNLSERQLDLALHPQYQARKIEYLNEIADTNLKQMYDFVNLFERQNPCLDPACFKLSSALGLPFVEVKEKLRRLVIRHTSEFKEFIDHQGNNSFLKGFIRKYEHV